MRLTYDIREVRPYINWIYFFYAWGLNGKTEAEKKPTVDDANRMLDSWEGRYHTLAVFDVMEAYSDGDDLLLGGTRIPLLRQQHAADGQPDLCLADFVRPLAAGVPDKVGAFATTVEPSMEHEGDGDVYRRMLAQVLSDRLAEATAELMHLQVRRHYWGYAPDENLSIDDLHAERFQGIRPAIGYPSLPDQWAIFTMQQAVDFSKVGIEVTANGAMSPASSISGLMISHPDSQYFMVGRIGDDQRCDYAQRRGITMEELERWLPK